MRNENITELSQMIRMLFETVYVCGRMSHLSEANQANASIYI